MLTALVMGEPARHREPAERKGVGRTVAALWNPFAEFFRRRGAALVVLFILLHKIGDTLANLTFRLLFDDLHFSKGMRLLTSAATELRYHAKDRIAFRDEDGASVRALDFGVRVQPQ